MNEAKNGAMALLATFFVIALATTFILPGRPTPAVITAFFNAASGSVRSTLGLNRSGRSLAAANAATVAGQTPGNLVASGVASQYYGLVGNVNDITNPSLAQRGRW